MKFTTGEVISAGTGRLCCQMDGVYRILNYLTGDNLYTHQLPRAFKACEAWVREHRSKTHTTTVYTRTGKKTVSRKTSIPSIAKVIARFLSSRTEAGRDECWIWNKSTNEKGYGQIMCAGKNIRAHQMAYMIHIGEIPGGVSVLHK